MSIHSGDKTVVTVLSQKNEMGNARLHVPSRDLFTCLAKNRQYRGHREQKITLKIALVHMYKSRDIVTKRLNFLFCLMNKTHHNIYTHNSIQINKKYFMINSSHKEDHLKTLHHCGRCVKH